jgi:hypothetical protein
MMKKSFRKFGICCEFEKLILQSDFRRHVKPWKYLTFGIWFDGNSSCYILSDVLWFCKLPTKMGETTPTLTSFSPAYFAIFELN